MAHSLHSSLEAALASRRAAIDATCSRTVIGTGGDSHWRMADESGVRLAAVHDSGFRGLTNLGATCYLNALLQMLYVLPDLRVPLLSAHSNHAHSLSSTPPPTALSHSATSSSTPVLDTLTALQRLFCLLYASSNGIVSTSEVVRSFGWRSAELVQQHDIVELFQLLIQQLLQSCSAPTHAPDPILPPPTFSPSASSAYSPSDSTASCAFVAPLTPASESKPSALPPDLHPFLTHCFFGNQLSWIRCLSCGVVRSRSEEFCTLPLPLPSPNAPHTLHHCLKQYLAEEKMEGADAYRCSSQQCSHSKQPALKGLTFDKLPHVLSLQLMRFELDYSTGRRTKLTTPVLIDEVMDMAVLGGSNPAADGENNAYSPILYDLYAILLHSGDANGGHYLSWIRDFSRDAWYKFNDEAVLPLNEQELNCIRGGDGTNTPSSSPSASPSSSTSAFFSTSPTCRAAPPAPPLAPPIASPLSSPPSSSPTPAMSYLDPRRHGYLLFYRRRDQSISTVSDSFMEDMVQRHYPMAEHNRQIDQRRAEQEKRLNSLTLEVYYPQTHSSPSAPSPSSSSSSSSSSSLSSLPALSLHTVTVQKDMTLSAVEKQVLKELGDVVPPSAHLRLYNTLHHTLMRPFTQEEMEHTLHQIPDLATYSKRSVLLEFGNGHFPVHKRKTITIQFVHFLSPSQEEAPVLVEVEESATLVELRTLLTGRITPAPTPGQKLRLFLLQGWLDSQQSAALTASLMELEDDDQTIKSLMLLNGDRVIGEVCSGEVSRVVEKYQAQNLLTLNFNNPFVADSEETLSLSVSPTLTISDLRTQLSTRLGCSPNQFRLRHPARLWQELKTGTLVETGLAEAGAVYVEEGQLLADTQHIVRIYKYVAPCPSPSSASPPPPAPPIFPALPGSSIPLAPPPPTPTPAQTAAAPSAPAAPPLAPPLAPPIASFIAPSAPPLAPPLTPPIAPPIAPATALSRSSDSSANSKEASTAHPVAISVSNCMNQPQLRDDEPFEWLGDLLVDDGWSMQEVMAKISQLPDAPPVDQMRLRDRQGVLKLTRVYATNLTWGANIKPLGKAGMRDYRVVVCEAVPSHLSTFTDQHLLLTLQQYHPDSNALGSRQEVVILNTAMLEDLAALASQHSSIPAQYLRFDKALSYHLNDAGGAVGTLKFKHAAAPTFLTAAPLHIKSGDTVLFLDGRLRAEVEEPAAEEEATDSLSSARTWRFSSKSRSSETGLKFYSREEIEARDLERALQLVEEQIAREKRDMQLKEQKEQLQEGSNIKQQEQQTISDQHLVTDGKEVAASAVLHSPTERSPPPPPPSPPHPPPPPSSSHPIKRRKIYQATSSTKPAASVTTGVGQTAAASTDSAANTSTPFLPSLSSPTACPHLFPSLHSAHFHYRHWLAEDADELQHLLRQQSGSVNACVKDWPCMDSGGHAESNLKQWMHQQNQKLALTPASKQGQSCMAIQHKDDGKLVGLVCLCSTDCNSPSVSTKTLTLYCALSPAGRAPASAAAASPPCSLVSLLEEVVVTMLDYVWNMLKQSVEVRICIPTPRQNGDGDSVVEILRKGGLEVIGSDSALPHQHVSVQPTCKNQSAISQLVNTSPFPAISVYQHNRAACWQAHPRQNSFGCMVTYVLEGSAPLVDRLHVLLVQRRCTTPFHDLVHMVQEKEASQERAEIRKLMSRLTDRELHLFTTTFDQLWCDARVEPMWKMHFQDVNQQNGHNNWPIYQQIANQLMKNRREQQSVDDLHNFKQLPFVFPKGQLNNSISLARYPYYTHIMPDSLKAFPGMSGVSDNEELACALRETREESGVSFNDLILPADMHPPRLEAPSFGSRIVGMYVVRIKHTSARAPSVTRGWLNSSNVETLQSRWFSVRQLVQHFQEFQLPPFSTPARLLKQLIDLELANSSATVSSSRSASSPNNYHLPDEVAAYFQPADMPVCRQFRASGQCQRGAACKFAHQQMDGKPF